MTIYSISINLVFFHKYHNLSMLYLSKNIFLMFFFQWNKNGFIDIIFKKIIDIVRKSIFLPIIIGKRI